MIEEAKKSFADHAIDFEVCDAHDVHDWLSVRQLTGSFDKVFRYVFLFGEME